MENTFIVKWTSESLDWVINVSGYDKRVMWEVLKGNEPFTLVDGIRNAIIYTKDKRTPFEMYSITIDDSVSEKEFIEMFQEDPVSAKALIRDRGRALHTQREPS